MRLQRLGSDRCAPGVRWAHLVDVCGEESSMASTSECVQGWDPTRVGIGSATTGLSDGSCGRDPDANGSPVPGPRPSERERRMSRVSGNASAGMFDMGRGRTPETEGGASNLGSQGVHQSGGEHGHSRSLEMSTPVCPTGGMKGCRWRMCALGAPAHEMSRKTGGFEDDQSRCDRCG